MMNKHHSAMGHTLHGGNRQALLASAREAGWDGEDASFIDASVNLNPLGPHPCLNEVLFSSYREILEYPNPNYEDLAYSAARFHGTDHLDYVFGNGADELIFALARLMNKIAPPSSLIRVPSYASYHEALDLAGFSISAEREWARLLDPGSGPSCSSGGIVLLGAPNNPDGELPPGYPDSLISSARNYPQFFYIVDEAFIDFSDSASLLDRGVLPENIIVIRSLTKIASVPGLRIGYAALVPHLAEALRRELPNWPLNSIAQNFAKRFFEDPRTMGFIQQTKAVVAAERERVTRALAPLYECSLSKANFILFRPLNKPEIAGPALRHDLLRHGMALRDCGNFPGLDQSWSRLAIKSPAENDLIIERLLSQAVQSKVRGPIPLPAVHLYRTRALMIQGCTSSAGKSVLVTALCRILRNRGIDVAPYKAQDMSNNAAVTPEGGEIGRAQAVQALACGLQPDVRMNPVLIKPEGDMASQVIVNGKSWNRTNARDYYANKEALVRYAQAAYDSLAREHELIILEGAGSPAEINLKDGDFVNMQAALHAGADVYLAGDIDRGGVFAAFLGHLATFTAAERRLLKGFIINKFRGDETLLAPAYEMLKNYTDVPIVGCIPYFRDIIIPEEDEHRLIQRSIAQSGRSPAVSIGVVRFPHASNFTDFEAFAAEPEVALVPVQGLKDLHGLDALILPGTKTTGADLKWLEQQGLAVAIRKLADKDFLVFGLCGGYQMLSLRIHDPMHIESRERVIPGLGVLPVETEFVKDKTLRYGDYEYCWPSTDAGQADCSWSPCRGYEIHHGQTRLIDPRFINSSAQEAGLLGQAQPFVRNKAGEILGYRRGNSMGSYLHGIFDNDQFRTDLINLIRMKKGLTAQAVHEAPVIDREIQKLAQLVERHCDIDKILKNLGFR